MASARLFAAGLRGTRLAAPLAAAALSAPGRPRPAHACGGGPKTDRSAEGAFWTVGTSGGGAGTIAATFDVFGGVIADPDGIPRDQATFRAQLQSSLSDWTAMGKKGVWLQIGIGSADLIPIATSEFGFEFHHAERGHVMLAKWLPKDLPNTLPGNASHTVGVGAVVTDSSGRVLLVKEKSGPAARMNIWKLPTGLVDAGEELSDAALREVREETGIVAKFDFLGGFTMNHVGNPAHPHKSNMFFIVKCSASSSDISIQESEIAEARWFTREEWAAMPFPEKGCIWHALNQSALEGKARLDMRQLPLGSSRPGHRMFYYPVPTPAL